MSTDSVEANALFAEAQGFEYPLLCDTERQICMAYGACDGPEAKSATRITYVISKEGIILQAHGAVDAREHPESLLETMG